jgi:hypothetical protein
MWSVFFPDRFWLKIQSTQDLLISSFERVRVLTSPCGKLVNIPCCIGTLRCKYCQFNLCQNFSNESLTEKYIRKSVVGYTYTKSRRTGTQWWGGSIFTQVLYSTDCVDKILELNQHRFIRKKINLFSVFLTYSQCSAAIWSPNGNGNKCIVLQLGIS